MQPRGTHIKWHQGQVTRADRESLHGHRAAVFWFTGLSGSGKSTLAHALEGQLLQRRCSAYVLDGDNVRHGLSSDLAFSPEERTENIRRIGEVAKLFVDAGVIVLCAFVSPYRADRDRVRRTLGEGDFVEIHVRASLEACRARDPKGLYGKAAGGEITNMTGVSAPYEPPERPEVVVDTEQNSETESVEQLLRFLERRGYIPASAKAPSGNP